MVPTPDCAGDGGAPSDAPRLSRPAYSPSALRVAGVDPELGFGGGESQVLGLALELLRGGHRAELLCNPEGMLWERAHRAGVECHLLSIRNALDFAAGMRLRSFLKRAHHDIVHFHTSRAHSLAPFARGCAGRLVVTRRMDYRPNRMFAPWLYNHAVDGVIAISGAVAQALVSAGVNSARIRIIPSGVDCGHFRPPAESERASARAALGLADGEIALGTVGALEHRKGHRYLLEAVAAIARCTASCRLGCFIAGDGPLRASLEADLRRLHPGSAVRLMGRLDDPRALLWGLDVFVFPSLKEGLGVAMLEAMACGLPVVASAIAGPAEVVEDGRTGVLFEAGNSAELEGALKRLIEAPGIRAALGAAAREEVIERFAMRVMAEKTLELYRACLGSGAAAARKD
jgi:glycosyltransferase involved in cell wall biosynthesis